MNLTQPLLRQPLWLAILCGLTSSPPLLAETLTSDNYTLSATVLSNGGDETSSSEYGLTAATIGQPFVPIGEKNPPNLASSLKVETTYTVKTVGQGDQITYTVTITNLGTETATGLIFTDIIGPEGAELLTIKADASGKGCEKKTASCELPDLAPNASIQVELVVQNKPGEAPANIAQVNSANYPASVDVIPDEITPPVPTPPETVVDSTKTTTPPSATETRPTEPAIVPPVSVTTSTTTVIVPPQPATATVPPQPATATVPPQPATATVPPQPATTTVPPQPATTTVLPQPATTTVPPQPGTVTAQPETATTPPKPETAIAPAETVIALPPAPPAPVTPPAEAKVTSTDIPPPVAEPSTVAPPAPPVVFLPAVMACPTEGDLEVTCNAYGQTLKITKILPGGQASNGVLEGTLTNQGWVSNLTITTTGQLIGGTVTGYIKNQGTMRDFEFRGMSIIGGILGGHIDNTSRVGGYFQDVTLLPDTHLTGGYLTGTIKGDRHSPAILEPVRVKRGNHLSGVKLGKGVKLEQGVVVETE